MSENLKKGVERPDRTLGDEWLDWDGQANANPAIKTGTGLFLAFALTVFLLIDLFLAVLYYFILPRLELLGPFLPQFVFWAFIIWGIASSLFWIQLALTVGLDKNFFFAKKQIFFVFDVVFGRVFKLAKFLRISRDRMGQSFVKVSNAVVKAIDKNVQNGRILILLPRCLTKEAIQEVYKLKEKYPVEIFTVSGGELARKKVKETNPSAIIGVACERDLVSGIRDIGHKISVIGIPNERPNGPCKETLLNMDELKKAVEFYLTPKGSSRQ